ncbi:dentin sialophosphoprotein-like isoform X2 [Dreissena polymorpha]|uniref:dentin sialophosphoprotein-like isoform X2 n=1 Tax=Dreissena polymorpha TaxID=45954 RepID=UPI002264F10F|nr:dentin sialophosphoprotein-like isoform X2 [Dreissena polymorpha]
MADYTVSNVNAIDERDYLPNTGASNGNNNSSTADASNGDLNNSRTADASNGNGISSNADETNGKGNSGKADASNGNDKSIMADETNGKGNSRTTDASNENRNSLTGDASNGNGKSSTVDPSNENDNSCITDEPKRNDNSRIADETNGKGNSSTTDASNGNGKSIISDETNGKGNSSTTDASNENINVSTTNASNGNDNSSITDESQGNDDSSTADSSHGNDNPSKDDESPSSADKAQSTIESACAVDGGQPTCFANSPTESPRSIPPNVSDNRSIDNSLQTTKNDTNYSRGKIIYSRVGHSSVPQPNLLRSSSKKHRIKNTNQPHNDSYDHGINDTDTHLPNMQYQMTKKMQRHAEASKDMLFRVFENVIKIIEEYENRIDEQQIPSSHIQIPDKPNRTDDDVRIIVEAQLLVFEFHKNSCPPEVTDDVIKMLRENVIMWAAVRDCPTSCTDKYIAKLYEILVSGKTDHAVIDKLGERVSASTIQKTLPLIMKGKGISMQLDASYENNPDKKAEHPKIRQTGNPLEKGAERILQANKNLFEYIVEDVPSLALR